MKIIKNILLLTIFFISISCNHKDKFTEKKQIVVTGKIHQYNGENAKLYFIYSQPGGKDSKELINIDSVGNFQYAIEGYIPLDAMLLEQTTFANINFIYHPGDSIHLEFKTNEKQLPLLKTVKFSGDRAETNNHLINFQILREENNLGYGVINPNEAYKKNTDDFITQMDSVKEKQLNIYNQFISKYTPNQETKNWAIYFANETYFYFLDDYSIGKNDLPLNYFDYNKQILPLTIDKLVSWRVLTSRINSYWRNITKPAIVQQFSDKMEEIKSGSINTDSLIINFINTESPDKLLSELLLAHYYSGQFGANIINGYQQNQTLLNSSLDNFFIKEVLTENYQATYDFINKPNEFTNEILGKIDNTPIEKTFAKILNDNRGKIIYLDCWATWCAPCIKAMPDSKKLMKKFEGKDIAFVYVCIESEEDLWKRLLSEFNLGGGQHYLLNKEQSEFFRNALDIQGIPKYFLIDKNGNIVEQGSHLHPSEKLAEEKIDKLMKE
ncbi:TlpA family protein disulfide reductase [Mangrovibacterium lignilyticum]|uniref:TlpA family protein disulfide reductase n=1 Tax=Mangrovibacterium lignilyticum TaxID=2668052 RepID=UPI0013D86716|nr:TlpA disulfide reductase family protein [Mangrovibacterium lignilyticum]